MKNNTEKSKSLLKQSLQHLPNDFALQEAKSSIINAINKIEQIEKRRINRDKQEKSQILEQQLKPFVGINPDYVLKHIDNLLETEKKNLQKLIDGKDKIVDTGNEIQSLHD